MSRYVNDWAFIESGHDEPRRSVELCRECGAVVWNEEAHDAWHDRHAEGTP